LRGMYALGMSQLAVNLTRIGRMESYIIRINSIGVEEYREVYAHDEEHAEQLAYEAWRDDILDNPDCGVVGLATDESREEYLK